MTEEEKKAFLAALLTHGNTHIEQVNLGDGYMNCTFGNTSNARQDNSNIEEAVVLPSTPEEAAEKAIQYVIDYKDNGAYCFRFQYQWCGIHRILRDKGICGDKQSDFINLVARMNLKYHDSISAPGSSVISDNEITVSFDEWHPDSSDKKKKNTYDLGVLFKAKLEDLLK